MSTATIVELCTAVQTTRGSPSCVQVGCKLAEFMVIEASAGLPDPVSAKLGFHDMDELYALMVTCDVLSAPRHACSSAASGAGYRDGCVCY